MKEIKFERLFFAALMIVVFVIALAGCFGGSSKPSKFYLLRSMEGFQPSVSKSSNATPVSVLIGPITLPAYLDRTQFVTLKGRHELVVEEYNRWGESLQDSFYRVLLEDLSLLLRSAEVYVYDRSGSISTDFQVVIDVTRFDNVDGGDACLTAFWTVIGRDSKFPIIKRKSVFLKGVPTRGIVEIIEAQNQTLTEFSHEIAAAIRSLQS